MLLNHPSNAYRVQLITLRISTFIAPSLRPGIRLCTLRLSSCSKTASLSAVRTEGAHAPDPTLRSPEAGNRRPYLLALTQEVLRCFLFGGARRWRPPRPPGSSPPAAPSPPSPRR